MKKIGKIVLLVATVLLLVCLNVACENKDALQDASTYEVYLAYAENGGKLSYDEWLTVL